MEITFLLFDNITALDAIGPLEVLARLPEAKVRFVGKQSGLVDSGSGGLALRADYALDQVTKTDILVVPGGGGTRSLRYDSTVTGWIRAVHETTTWTTSVCTGSLLLGAAGLLQGLKATTHWSAMDLLAEYGAITTDERVIRQGKIITSAGVSSGIDMALTLAAELAGDTVAQSIQLGIEYDPQPPFDSGSLAKASPEVRRLCGAS